MRKIITALTSIALTLALAGSAAAAMPIVPSQFSANIVITPNDSVCGLLTVNAHGYGLRVGETYQIVASSGPTPAIAIAKANATNTISATFSRAASGEWGYVQIRTIYGGYLSATTYLGGGLAGYHVRACS